MANGEHIEVAKAFITIVPSMEGSQKTISEEMGAVTEPAAKEAGEKSGKTLGENLAKGLKATTAVIAGAMAAATGAAVATGKAFIDTANDISAMGDQIGDNAAKMGISTQAYQEWDFILQRAGSSIDSMKTSMKTLANAAESGSDAFAQLGISQEEVASLNQEQLFARTVSALSDVDDVTTRTALASKLLGKGAMELGGVFDMTSEEIEATKQEMYDLGVYMDKDMINASDRYQDTMLNMQDSVKGLKMSLVKNFLPGITTVMEGLSLVFSGRGGVAQIKEGLTSIIQNITAMAPQLFELAGVLIQSLLDGFAPMLPQLVSSLFSFLEQGLLTITGLIPQLTPVIVTGIQGIMTALFSSLPVIIDGLTTLLIDLVTWLSEGNNVTMFVDGIIELVSKLASSMAAVLPVLIPAIVTIISEVALALTDPENVSMLLNATLDIVAAVVEALINSLPLILKLVIDLGVNIVEGTVAFLGTLLSRLGEWIGQALSNVGKFATDVVNKVKDLPKKFLNGAATFLRNLLTNIGQWITQALSKVGEFATNIFNRVKDLPSKFSELGKNIIQGLINGVKKLASSAVETVKSIGTSLVNGVKSTLKIGSPSKVFAQIGAWTAEGFAIGYEDTMDDVAADMQSSMEDLTGNMTATVKAYGPQGAETVGNETVYNGGNVSINVYGAEGQSITALADEVAYRLQEMTRRKEMIWG